MNMNLVAADCFSGALSEAVTYRLVVQEGPIFVDLSTGLAQDHCILGVFEMFDFYMPTPVSPDIERELCIIL